MLLAKYRKASPVFIPADINHARPVGAVSARSLRLQCGESIALSVFADSLLDLRHSSVIGNEACTVRVVASSRPTVDN